MADHPRPDRVEHDIAGQLQEVRLLLHNDPLVPALEHMPHAPMPPVEALGIDPVQLAHAFGQVAVRRLDQQVIVVVHQAVRVHGPVEVPHDFR